MASFANQTMAAFSHTSEVRLRRCLFLSGILIGLTVSDGVDESLVVKVTSVVLGGGVEEDIELFLGESVGLGGKDFSKVGGGDGAGAFGVENLKQKF